jgi:hypothetical protein
MGYGNPLFDGDEPLPTTHRPRVLPARLWLGAVLAGILGDGAALRALGDEDRGSRDSHSPWRPGQADRDPQR